MKQVRFLPQTTLDAWVDQGKVDLRHGYLVETSSRAEYPIREALHFLKLESGTDVQRLLNKVKTLESVKAIGGEHYMNSVILGDDVFQVVLGWLTEEIGQATAAASPPAGQGASKKAFEGKDQEADMLAKLLLDKLS